MYIFPPLDLGATRPTEAALYLLTEMFNISGVIHVRQGSHDHYEQPTTLYAYFHKTAEDLDRAEQLIFQTAGNA